MIPRTRTSRVLSGLTNGVPVEIGVRALVDGSWRAWTFGTAIPVGGGDPDPDPPPTGGVVVVVAAPTAVQPALTITSGDALLDVAWATSVSSSQHQIRWRPAGVQLWTWADASVSTSRSLVGLSNGTAYEIEVRSYNGGIWQGWTRGVATPSA